MRGLRFLLSSLFCRACSVIAALVLALRITADDTFLASQVFLACSGALRDILDSWQMPPFLQCVCDGSRGPGSCTRLCAVIYLCEGQGAPRAVWLGSAHAGHLRWVGSLGIEIAGPRSSRGPRKCAPTQAGPSPRSAARTRV